MIFAKCIRVSQVVDTVEQFNARSNDESVVYCVGQTSRVRNGQDTLYCVPLNLIYSCLKYGDKIAIIDVENDEEYRAGSVQRLQISSSEQHVLQILDADSRETIDFVFNQVNNREIVSEDYIHFLSPESVLYFKMRKYGQ